MGASGEVSLADSRRGRVRPECAGHGECRHGDCEHEERGRLYGGAGEGAPVERDPGPDRAVREWARGISVGFRQFVAAHAEPYPDGDRRSELRAGAECAVDNAAEGLATGDGWFE